MNSENSDNPNGTLMVSNWPVADLTKFLSPTNFYQIGEDTNSHNHIVRPEQIFHQRTISDVNFVPEILFEYEPNSKAKRICNAESCQKKIFANKKNFINHLSKHFGPIKCPKCPQNSTNFYPSYQALKVHERSAHPVELPPNMVIAGNGRRVDAPDASPNLFNQLVVSDNEKAILDKVPITLKKFTERGSRFGDRQKNEKTYYGFKKVELENYCPKIFDIGKYLSSLVKQSEHKVSKQKFAAMMEKNVTPNKAATTKSNNQSALAMYMKFICDTTQIKFQDLTMKEFLSTNNFQLFVKFFEIVLERENHTIDNIIGRIAHYLRFLNAKLEIIKSFNLELRAFTQALRNLGKIYKAPGGGRVTSSNPIKYIDPCSKR